VFAEYPDKIIERHVLVFKDLAQVPAEHHLEAIGPLVAGHELHQSVEIMAGRHGCPFRMSLTQQSGNAAIAAGKLDRPA